MKPPARTWSALNWLSFAAMLAAAALALSSMVRAIDVDPFPGSVPAGPAPATDEVVSPQFREASAETVNFIVSRDPFHPLREGPSERYGRTSSEARGSGEDPTVHPIRLIGTVINVNGGGFVLCQIGDDRPRIVRIGQPIGSFTLTEVGRGRARLQAGDGESLDLRIPMPGAAR